MRERSGGKQSARGGGQKVVEGNTRTRRGEIERGKRREKKVSLRKEGREGGEETGKRKGECEI